MPEEEPLYKPFEPPEVSRRSSLFWKVLAIIVGTVVLATGAIWVYYEYAVRTTYNRVIAEQLHGYLNLVATEVEEPLSKARLDAITDRYPLDLRVESHDGVIATDTTLPSFNELLQRGPTSPSRRESPYIFLVQSGRFYGGLATDSYLIVARFRSNVPSSPVLPATIVLAVLLILLFSLSWFFVRRFLSPIDELMEGVKAVGSADFKHRVPIRSTDELGTLASAFNAMSEQIGEIIESKRRLLFDVSHELRSPLTRMNIVIAMLPDGKQRDKLERNANELNTMITELLENERLAVLGAALVVEEVDVVGLARGVVESFTTEEDRIEFETLTESLEIFADQQRLTVAIRNVVSNALKYSGDAVVNVRVFPDYDGARIVVQDHGIGIPPESIEKIFEPFYRTDESRTRTTGGYGLGLALTRAIIDAHGGTINAESKEGEGTTFTIWLPKEAENAPISAPASTMESS